MLLLKHPYVDVPQFVHSQIDLEYSLDSTRNRIDKVNRITGHSDGDGT